MVEIFQATEVFPLVTVDNGNRQQLVQRHDFSFPRRIRTVAPGTKKLREFVIIDLRVHGVVGLSLNDKSVMPIVPGSHLAAMTYAVDENGVALILDHASSQR
ncbi:hypothetical protein S40293_11355 [Stachybotrys chartarum IBT 40293]|nr:hypothetical protein S40293_11355 [Stachybotrys chartarum IBT 40293]